jgi:L-proline amide hydrolase
VVYDQLGCGSSDHPDDRDLWTVELFLEELRTIRKALRLELVHLLGTSWGSMLALEYVLRRPDGVVSLTLNSPPTATSTWAAEATRLRAPLAEDETVAEEQFWRLHICRLEPWPDCIIRGRAEKGRQVYETLWGASEWSPDGRLRDWDVRPRLGQIDLPTLITSGRYDECTPALAEEAHQRIHGSDWVLFEDSSHTAFLEEPERFRAVLADFLARAEQS